MVVLLGSVGYIAVGTLLASMAVQTRTRDMLLPILLFPVVIPLIVAAVKASSRIYPIAAYDRDHPVVEFIDRLRCGVSRCRLDGF